MINFSKRRAQAMIFVLIAIAIISAYFAFVLLFQQNQTALLSKSAKDYMAVCVAETGLHCLLAEMKADYQFVTHGNIYVPVKGWGTSSKSQKFNYIKGNEHVELAKNTNGNYEGTVNFKEVGEKGQFKARVKLLAAKNATETKTIDESHAYFLLESFGKVGDSCKRVSAILQKITPGNYLFYDGDILDLGGYGPNRLRKGIITGGRIYGHEMLVFSKKGKSDSGLAFEDVEKISTPGAIVAYDTFPIDFPGGKKGSISTKNDSYSQKDFETYGDESGDITINGKLLDGPHGAKSEKLPALNPKYYREATRPSPTILSAGSSFDGFKESKWKNPLKPSETVYDLFFGWKFEQKGDNCLIYSEVPLRIWGNPPYKALTIFCEKDVYIAGDLNTNPLAPQRYEPGYSKLAYQPKNGRDKNGLQILSMGRIWFDYSNPMNFMRNELHTLIDYDLANSLSATKLNTSLLKEIVFPKRDSHKTYKRLPFTFINFSALNSMYHMPKESLEMDAVIAASLPFHPALRKLRSYLNKPGKAEPDKLPKMPSQTPELESGNAGVYSTETDKKLLMQDNKTRPQAQDDNNEESGGYIGGTGESEVHFPIESAAVRVGIYETIGALAYATGTIPPQVRDKIIEKILTQAEKEMFDKNGSPVPESPVWTVMDRLMNTVLAHRDTGFRFPEMTVNALLVDSAATDVNWDLGNSATKTLQELGNIADGAMNSLPYTNKNTRFILRHHGSRIHLRTAPSDVSIKKKVSDDQSVMRKNSFDNTFVRGGGDYFPPYPMNGFIMINWEESSITPEEFKDI